MKKIARLVAVVAVALAALGITALPASAANAAAADLTTQNQVIRASQDVGIFGISLTGTGLDRLNSVKVTFAQVGTAPDFNFDDLDASPDDGVALWRDDGAVPDSFDAGDHRVSDSFSFDAATLTATLGFSPAEPLPSQPEGDYTYFVTVRASTNATDGADFTVTLPSDAFNTTLPTLNFAAVTSHPITIDPTAPTVTSFLPPVAQTDNIVWHLSEAVTGVSSSTVAFRLHGTTTDVPAAVSWVAAGNTIVVDPVSPLTAGQYYDALLLPNGPGAIVDRAGNQLQPDPHWAIRAATDVAENAYGAAYSWRSVGNKYTYGGSYATNNTPGASASWTFTGTSVTWYTIADPYQGKAAVYIDGHAMPTVNNYSSTVKYLVARTYSGLSSTKHTILVRVTGSKGSTSAKDVRVAVDAFKAGGVLYKTPAASYGWGAIGTSGAAGGSYLASRMYSTAMTFTFRGTHIDWRTVLAPSMGRAAVYIDNVFKGTVDNYSGVTIFKFYRSYSGLSDGLHTIKIVVAATKNSLAKDSFIAVDGFVVG